MSLGAGAAPWRRTVSRSRLGAAVKLALVAISALLLAQYLAGYFFLWWVSANPREASPLTIARYAYYYGDHTEVRHRLTVSSAIGLGLVGITALIALLPKPRALHGNARFARAAEIERAGLFAKHGLFLGRFGRRYLILGGQQGAIVSAPPRSDKGTAIVVPNCLLWPGSLICQDIKLENWHLTAGYRARMGQPCYLINPLDPSGNTACSNPLSYVSADPNLRISGLQRIAATLFPEIPGTDPFWTAGGRGLFLGLALYVLETPSLPSSLGEVLRQGMASDAEGFSAHWKRTIAGRQSGRYPLSAQCVRAISDIMDLAPVTASSIRKTFTSRLDLFANPLIDAATSRNDFDWRDLRKRPMSIYLGIQPGDLQLLRPLLNLLLEQAISLQTEELPDHNPALKHQVLMLLDECTAPGRIPILAQAISYLPGYNIRLLLVIQAFSQLREAYGQNAADTMMKSLAARVLYAPKDYAEANEISQELGNTTVRVKNLSQPRFALFAAKGQRHGNISTNEQKRPLLLPQEVKELGRDRELLLYEGLRPILANKNRYFEDPFLARRLLPPPAQATPVAIRAGLAPSPPLAPNAPPATDPAFDGIAATPAATAGGASRSDQTHLDEITLDDVDIDFSQVVLPQKAEGERLTVEELDSAVNSFITALRER
ncbi:MAG: type IV secretory system conjugative DNA transfer family protein [Steroidobacter sp.]